MTGREEREIPGSRCPLCGGALREGVASLPFFIGERIIVIKYVPSEICSDCGEPFMKSGVSGRIESLLDKLEDLASEMSVVHYQAA